MRFRAAITPTSRIENVQALAMVEAVSDMASKCNGNGNGNGKAGSSRRSLDKPSRRSLDRRVSFMVRAAATHSGSLHTLRAGLYAGAVYLVERLCLAEPEPESSCTVWPQSA